MLSYSVVMNKLDLYLSESKRLQVWVALAQLFAEVMPSEHVLESIANELQAAQVERQTLYTIYRYEVAPCFWRERWMTMNQPPIGWYSPRQITYKVGLHVKNLSPRKKRWIDVKWKLFSKWVPNHWQQLEKYLA
ncbi:DUF7079 family protein [Spartinivicinus poritis]|uniref:DUF7079 domain-containing protein n=1 Tax=Spartinivicinus poritis TaxID=2994640 RepID=A0ABT5UE72_9GAMM|nr:hypothetical protein [Spartinivicinus sp. A2-2]MDE1464663.1 hypothetical protein [Spartinivicinus sp. A2-2]